MKRYVLPLLLLLVFFISACHRNEHLINLKAYQIKTKEMFAKTKLLAKERDSALFGVMDSNLTIQEREGMEFLYAFAPLSDLADYNGDYFLSQVRASLKAREEMPWGKKVPEQLFLHFVLPIRVNNENLDTFRSATYEELKARVQGMSMDQAALEVNHWCHEKVTYKGSDERTSSPLASMRTSWGRCGEESTFTVAALRAVGIPARQVYTPRWAHTDDNHAWVEVWVNDRWHFMGACEPEARLDKGWFEEPAKRAMLVHTRAYGWYRGNEPRIQSEERFSELNLIENYAQTKDIIIEVKDSLGKAVSQAKVEFQLYNYAEYYPIAKATTDKLGRANLRCGLGDLLVWVSKDSLYGYKLVKGVENGIVAITLTNKRPKTTDEVWDITPPARPLAAVADTVGSAVNRLRLKQEDEIRTKYTHTFKDSAYAAAFARELSYPRDTIKKIIRNSLGNWKEITKFLRNVSPENKMWACRMLLKLNDKDLRDVTADVLQDHLKNGMMYISETGSRYADFFSEYMLSPRIGNEMLRPWRGFLQSKFDRRFRAVVRDNPQHAVDWMLDNLKLDQVNNLHSRAPISPEGVYELKLADQRSMDIFFVALCRASGLPARLNPVTGKPQALVKGNFEDIILGTKEQEAGKMGSIALLNGNDKSDPQYTTHFTLAHFKNGVYRTYEFPEGRKVSDFPSAVDVEAGDWMLVTGNRMADGGVLSSVHFFNVEEGKTTQIEVVLREPKVEKAQYGKADIKGIELKAIGTGETINSAKMLNATGALWIWLDPGKEPSRHVLADLPAFKEELETWNGAVNIIIPKNLVPENYDPKSMAGLPKQSVFLSEEKQVLISRIEKLVQHPLAGNLPVIVLLDSEQNVIFLSEGYTIGIGEQIGKLIGK
ncbi:MAG: transglutaminase-like domain-containing protein [Bacteroidota bacterium]